MNIFSYLSSSQIVKQLDEVMASELNLILLEKKIIEIISPVLNSQYIIFLLASDFNARPVGSLGDEGAARIKYAKLEAMIHHVKSTLVYEQLTDKVARDLFTELNIRIMLPLTVADEDIGLMVIGPKTSGRYNNQDIKFLESIIKQMSRAIKNADSYRRIEDFNRTLETKVIDRTHELERSQAEQLKLKDEFVFIATHDLATPVTAISGFTALIKNSKENISPQVSGYLSAIAEASNRLKTLVNDLLQVARSDSGTIKVELTTVDAGKIIESTTQQMTPLASEKNVKINLSLGSDNTVRADPTKFSEIIENLLSNAIKYNKEGGSITVSSKIDGSKLLLEIADSGIGIPVIEQPKVFTKFFRSDSPEARSRPGTGLGLFVARMLTEKMGGTISFESKEGQGTIFRLSFNR